MATSAAVPAPDLGFATPSSRARAVDPSHALERDGGTTTRWYVRCDIIERARLLAGKTRRELATAAQVDDKTLRDMLNHRRRPTIATVHCVIRALALDPTEVIVFDPGRDDP